MSLVNIYLKETPLTSTKNKYLDDNIFTDRLKSSESLKRKFKRKLLITAKCNTENRILFESKFNLEKDDDIKKKKKKKAKACVKRGKFCIQSRQYCPTASSEHSGRDRSFDRSRSYSLSPETDSAIRRLECTDSAIRRLECTEDSEDMPHAMDFRSKELPAPGFTFGTAQGLSAPGFRYEAVQAPQAAYFKLMRSNFRNIQEQHQVPLLSSLGNRADTLAFGGAAGFTNIAETLISKMPTYKFESLKLSEETEYEFFTKDISQSQNFISDFKGKKMELLNIVSMALMYSSNLKNENDVFRELLSKSADDVKFFDPEFILKVALYTRQELHIRTVTNFLLSYAALHENTRFYLEKYFEASIVLPSDWIQVAEYYKALSAGSPKQSFPAALRRAMKNTFVKFDQYQLAKYNRDKSKKKKSEKIKDSEVKDDKYSFTLKKLIRILHIDSPAEHVLNLLGKKYPDNYEAFKSSGLPGTWDSSKAGARMKLPTPETWETKLPLHGNVPHVWESLIDNNKLPYMASLRNIKNLILSGISPTHHKKVIKHLENKTAVINSRQLPLQFFEAYKVLSDLENMVEGKDTNSSDLIDIEMPEWQKKRLQKTQQRLQNASVPVINQYKNAISNAIEISSLNNLHPVPGKTIVICMLDKPTSSNKLKNQEACLMMGLMCLKACEDCKMHVPGFSDPSEIISLTEGDKFLDIMMETCEKFKKMEFSAYYGSSDALEDMLKYYLKPQNILSLKLDHIVLLEQQPDCNLDFIMPPFLHKYRQIVNSNLLYTKVTCCVKSSKFSKSCLSDKDVCISGTNSSIIKFIADRSGGGQLTYVDNIDIKYDLPKISESRKNRYLMDHSIPSSVSDEAAVVPSICKTPKWHTVRIFVSSTFKDMMSERDLLVRYVFPELRRRAASVFVRIVEVDLRWGITEADSSTQRAATCCLLEAQKADIFVGLIGSRYGTIYTFDPPNARELQWVKDCPSGLSITELEIHAAALRDPESCREKAFFYFRDMSFLSLVPQKWISHFNSEDEDAKNKVAILKNKIRENNFKIFHSYPCHFAGIYENKPILAGLDALGSRVLEDLWEAIQKIHKRDPYYDNIGEEEISQQNLIDSCNFYVGEKYFPIETIVKAVKIESGVFAVVGSSGSGKTAFAVQLLQHLKSFAVVKFFIGLSPRSQDLSYMLQYICNSLGHVLSVSLPVPDLPQDIVNQFPDILMEAVNCSGGRDIILIIDGLDHLEKDDQTLDWLPLSLPDGIKLICTVNESSDAFKVLCGREVAENITFCRLPPLQQSDREKFVRNYLKQYSKTLDESAFNNHMLKIVTKTESSNPLYLQIVCDFLRPFATFDNLSSILQKMPSSIALLFKEIILMMENEFGCTLVQNVLTLLCITKEGLQENDLHFVLSLMHMNEMKTSLSFNELKQKVQLFEPEHLLSQAKFCSLMYGINTFSSSAINEQNSISLVGTEFEKAVKKFYVNKNYVTHSIFLHSVLAGYYSNMCDINNDGRYSGQNGYAVRSLLYHMFHGNLYKELNDLLCCHRFLIAAFMTNAGTELMEYYSALLNDILPSNQKLSHEINSFELFTFYDFVSRNFHIFQQYPQLVIQQAVNEPSISVVNLKSEDCNYHLLENLSRSHLIDYRLATFCGFMKNITASASEKRNPCVVLGTEDGYLKILNLSTRKVARTIKGHVSAITCITFVGDSRLCVSSVDGTLSLWDSSYFTRIAVMNGHKHNVTSCCGDPSGSILFSAGWDNSVRLWSLADGRSISVIDAFRCPVNCVAHHPLKQQIACGLWSGNIEIWDTVTMKKILGISSFRGSVKSLVYTPDGVNIISSFFGSEISIWSSEEGLKISSLKGHILPVKSLSFSYDDNMFVTGSDDCTLKVWSSVNGSNFSTISDCKFCPISFMHFLSEQLLAVAFQNSDIWIIDINSGGVTCKLSLDSDFVSAFGKYVPIEKDFENNVFDKFVVFGTQNGKIMIGDLLTSSTSLWATMRGKITAIIYNSEVIACGSAEGDIGVFYSPDNKMIIGDIGPDGRQSSKVIAEVHEAHRGFISTLSVALIDDSPLLLTTGNDNVLKLWVADPVAEELILQKELHNSHKDGITYSCFNSYYNDSSFLTGSHDNNIIFRSEDSEKVFQGLHSSVVNIACSGKYILGCSNDGAIVMWSQNGKVLTSIPPIEVSSSTLTFFAAEDQINKFNVILAFVDQDGSIAIRKPLQKKYSCSFEGHSKPITSCCTTENGDVVSSALDGSVNLWKIPLASENIPSMHSSMVNGITVSSSLELAVSSDADGNLILWKINLADLSSPLTYAGKKNYSEGFIRALSWMQGNNFVCAGSHIVGDNEEKYFLHLISVEHTSTTVSSMYSFQVKKSFDFDSEVLCLDSCPSTDVIVVGLKSGNAVIIKSETEYLLHISSMWLVGVVLFSDKSKSDSICVALDGGINYMYKVDDVMKLPEGSHSLIPEVFRSPLHDLNVPEFAISSMCYGNELICCGDAQGVLRIFFDGQVKFIEKVHNDIISGMCIVGSHLFTCSFDKSLKGWDLKSYKQICQYYSSVPISCITAPKVDANTSDESSSILLMGTTSGNVYVLKFHKN